MKKYLVISILINVFLFCIHKGYFQENHHIEDSSSIVETLEINSQLLANESEVIRREILSVIYRKPKVLKPMVIAFDGNRKLADDFSFWLDDIVSEGKGLSVRDMEQTQFRYIQIRDDFISLYKKQLKACQEVFRLTDDEVGEKILLIEQGTEDRVYYDSLSLRTISKDYRRILLAAMKNDVRRLQLLSTRDFASMIGGSLRFNRKYPAILSYFPLLKKGESQDLEIALGTHLSMWELSRYASVYLDGEKIELGYERNQKISIPTTSKGKKEHKAVIEWRNPYTNELGVDTTVFYYEVL